MLSGLRLLLTAELSAVGLAAGRHTLHGPPRRLCPTVPRKEARVVIPGVLRRRPLVNEVKPDCPLEPVAAPNCEEFSIGLSQIACLLCSGNSKRIARSTGRPTEFGDPDGGREPAPALLSARRVKRTPSTTRSGRGSYGWIATMSAVARFANIFSMNAGGLMTAYLDQGRPAETTNAEGSPALRAGAVLLVSCAYSLAFGWFHQ